MTMKQAPVRSTSRRQEGGRNTVISQLASYTPEERLQRIEALGERIAGYVKFMCERGNLGGTSAEATERAVAAFYEQMIVVERQLGRIQEDLQLE